MANTTFNGPVRSDNGFETISKNATTGAVTIEADYNVRPNFRASIDNSTFAGAGGARGCCTPPESFVAETEAGHPFWLQWNSKAAPYGHGCLEIR